MLIYRSLLSRAFFTQIEAMAKFTKIYLSVDPVHYLQNYPLGSTSNNTEDKLLHFHT